MGALLALLVLSAGPPLVPSSAVEPAGAQPAREAEEAKPGKDDAAPPPPLDFDLLPPETKASATVDLKLEKDVRRRRGMLTLHQGLGIATWTALAATVTLGQLNFDDRFRGGGDTGRWRGAHRTLAYGSTALFAGTGLLALLAPEPYEKRARLDTATLHKVSMGVATAGIATQIVLGIAARRSGGKLGERDLASAHQLTGYATLGAMTVGAVVLFF